MTQLTQLQVNELKLRDALLTDSLIQIEEEIIRIRESTNLRLQNLQTRIRRLTQERPP